MLNILKTVLKRVLPSRWLNRLAVFYGLHCDGFVSQSYAQQGEDMIMRHLLGDEKISKGFYVDVGAHHPKRFSNTYYFYKQGWHGINIDAAPGFKKIFDRFRPRDINVEAAIGQGPQILRYYICEEASMNTFDPGLAKEREGLGFKIVATKEQPIKPLSSVLREYLPQGQKVDFLSVDVEGLDLSVLKSNNWQEVQPLFILCEFLNKNIIELDSNDVVRFLKPLGYAVVACTKHTLIFKHNIL